MIFTLNEKHEDEDEIYLEWEGWGWWWDLPWIRRLRMRMRSTLNEKVEDEDEIYLEWECWGWGWDLPWIRMLRMRMRSTLNKKVMDEDEIYLEWEGWGWGWEGLKRISYSCSINKLCWTAFLSNQAYSLIFYFGWRRGGREMGGWGALGEVTKEREVRF